MQGRVRVERRAGRGRCAVAASNIAAGELVWRERPLATVLHHKRWGKCCNGCYRATWSEGTHTVFCCGMCERYVYCSRECASVDWVRGHGRECALLQTLPSSIAPDTVELLLLCRLLQQRPLGQQSLDALRQAAQAARDEGDDDRYFALKRQIKDGGGEHLPPLGPPPPLREWHVVDGVRVSDSGCSVSQGDLKVFEFAAGTVRLEQSTPQPEPEPSLHSVAGNSDTAMLASTLPTPPGTFITEYSEAVEMTWQQSHLNQSALHNLSAMAQAFKVVESELEAGKWFSRFQANNFYLSRDDSGRAPLESCWAPVALAICPRTALLNHSCAPNCFVTTIWPSEQAVGAAQTGALLPTLALVAREFISAGEELCHSYIDSSDATRETTNGALTLSRRSILRSKYGFECSCPLCGDLGVETAATTE